MIVSPGIYSPVNNSADRQVGDVSVYGYTDATAYWLDVGNEQGGNDITNRL
ncbi:MAG: hypothetical protein ABSG08_22320 [Terriglobales bacterium]